MSRPPAPPAPGQTTIAPTVLITVARLTALSVPGVARLAPVPGGVNRFFRRGTAEGVRLELSEESVSLALHLVLLPETDVRAVARRVQADVARAVEETVGKRVGRVDIHVEDIDYDAPAG